MPKIDVELSVELIKAIKEHRGELSVSEFIAQGMKIHMSPKIKLNKEAILKRWSV